MKWSGFKVPVKVEQINEYLFSDTVQVLEVTIATAQLPCFEISRKNYIIAHRGEHTVRENSAYIFSATVSSALCNQRDGA